jgi:DNA primase
MITRGTIEKIMDAARIEDVVGDFVNLKRRGVNLVGLCPFHQEKTPSFNVLPAKNIYKCFGCGQGGDTIQFLREHDGLSYEEALRYLARKYHIEVEETKEAYTPDPEQDQKDAIWIVNQFARDFYVDQLWHREEGQHIGLAYFKERGLREATIRKFDLGYAPASGSALSVHAAQAGHQQPSLKQAGLVTERGGDFFRDRVMFTIHSLTGKPQAFAGRVMGKTAKGPKYMNSPETLVYHKSRVLYGLYQARTAIRKEKECFLVEGYTDVLAMSQEGIENVVASSGTALTVEQIHLIRRFTPNITILYDGDKAGQAAALRGLDLILEEGMNVRLVLLPDGHDPDSYLGAAGREAFMAYIQQQKKDFILFKTDVLLSNTAHDPAARTEVIKEVVQSIARINDQLKRGEYVKSCAQIMAVDEAILIQEVNKLLVEKMARERRADSGSSSKAPPSDGPEPNGNQVSPKPSAPKPHMAIEMDLARILINGGHKRMIVDEMEMSVADFILGHFDEEQLEEWPDVQLQKLFVVSKNAQAKGISIHPGFFVSHQDDDIRTISMQCLSTREEYSENWDKKHGISLHNQPMPEDNYDRDARIAINRYSLKRLDHLCLQNADRIRQAYEHGDQDQLTYFMKLQKELFNARNQLAEKELNTTILR